MPITHSVQAVAEGNEELFSHEFATINTKDMRDTNDTGGCKISPSYKSYLCNYHLKCHSLSQNQLMNNSFLTGDILRCEIYLIFSNCIIIIRRLSLKYHLNSNNFIRILWPTPSFPTTSASLWHIMGVYFVCVCFTVMLSFKKNYWKDQIQMYDSC